MGTRTLDTVPGLKRHCRKASVVLLVLLSRIALPVLCSMVASVTLPLAVLTVTMQTPSPVICWRFARSGYTGIGALMASAFADAGGVRSSATAWGFVAGVACLFTPVPCFAFGAGGAGAPSLRV